MLTKYMEIWDPVKIFLRNMIMMCIKYTFNKKNDFDYAFYIKVNLLF